MGVGLGAIAAAAACSSGSSDVANTPDTGGGGSTSSSSTSSSGATASSSSSSGGGADATPEAAGSNETILYGFDGPDAGVGCWAAQPYGTPGGPGYPSLDAGEAAAAGDAGTPIMVGDAGAELLPVNGYYYLASFSTLSYDPAVGNPTPGSLEVEVPFNGYNEQALFDCNFATMMDFSNKILFAQVKVDSGFSTSASAPGGFVIAVKSGTSYVYAQNSYTNLPANGQWTQFEFDLSNPAMANMGFDPTQIVAIELHFDTGGGAAGAPAPSPAVFHVDNIGLRSP